MKTIILRLKITTILIMMFFASSVFAADYNVLEREHSTANPDRIEVLNFYSYTCKYCYELEMNYLRSWGVPEDVDLIGVPVLFKPELEPMSRGYIASEILGIAKDFHPELFYQYKIENKKFRDAKSMAKIAAKFGVTEKEFIDTYNSFAVDRQFRRVQSLTKEYKMRSVPNLVVNGKYQTGPSIAKGFDNTMKALDELIEKERQ